MANDYGDNDGDSAGQMTPKGGEVAVDARAMRQGAKGVLGLVDGGTPQSQVPQSEASRQNAMLRKLNSDGFNKFGS